MGDRREREEKGAELASFIIMSASRYQFYPVCARGERDGDGEFQETMVLQ
jgi:hypothetical protein